MKEMTAVEWLEAHLIEYGFDLSLHKFEIKQAKEMEKQNLYNFYMQGGIDAIFEGDRTVEDYYNETFNKE